MGRIIFCGFVLSIASGVGWVFWFVNAKPILAVNYVQEYNQLTCPPNYNPNENAWPLYQKAISVLEPMPEYFVWIKRDKKEIRQEYLPVVPRSAAPVLRYKSRKAIRFPSLTVQEPNEPVLDPEWFRFDAAEDCYFQKVRENWPNWPGDFERDNLIPFEDWIWTAQEAYRYLTEAASKSYCWIERDPDRPLYRLQAYLRESDGFDNCRTFLGWLAKWNAYQQNPEAALAALTSLERINDFLDNTQILGHISDDALWRSRMSRCVLTLVKHQSLSEDMLARLQRFLEEHSSTPLVPFEFDRLCALDLIQRIFTDDRKGNGRFIAGQYIRLFEINFAGMGSLLHDPFELDQWGYFIDSEAFRTQLYHQSLFGEDRRGLTLRLGQVFADTYSLLSLSPYEIQTHNLDLEKANMLCSYQDPLSKLNEYGSGNVVYYHRILSKSWERPVVAILALHRYRLRTGQFPGTLEDLVEAGYLKEVPLDPYSGTSLVYRRTGDDFILYSIGQDMEDDGGKPMIMGPSKKGDQVFWPLQKQEGNPYLPWSMEDYHIVM